MSGKVDTQALRALVAAVRAEGRDAGYVGRVDHMHWTELAEQIAALLDAAEELEELKASAEMGDHEACEACHKRVGFEDIIRDAEGAPLCMECYEELKAETEGCK